MKVFGVFLILLISSLLTLASEDTLQMTHVLYRHGDRTPIEFCRTDPYSDMKYWPEGLGQLTNKGMAMEYKLGGWLRTRYGNFISEKYNTREMYILSTEYERTLMSAAAVTGAFYYPDVDIRFNKSIPWMPTPIHSAPSAHDKIINVDAACPRVTEAVKEAHELPGIVQFNEDHQQLFDILTEKCGEDMQSIRRVGFMLDTLFVEKSHGFVLPDWANEHFEQMQQVANFSFLINTYTTELKRLRAGPLLALFSKHMNKMAKGEEGNKKLYMYSAHDSTVAIVLHSMGAYNGLAPPYASTVLVELHKIDNKDFVKMYFRNDTNIVQDAYPIALEGCEHVCPLEKWSALMSVFIPEDWEDECYVKNPKTDAIIIIIVTGTLIGVCMIAVMIAVVCYARNGFRKHSSQYQLLTST